MDTEPRIVGDWFCCNAMDPQCASLDPDGNRFTSAGEWIELQALPNPDDPHGAGDPTDGYCEAEVLGIYELAGPLLTLTDSDGDTVELGWEIEGDRARLSTSTGQFLNTCFRLSPELFSGPCDSTGS